MSGDSDTESTAETNIYISICECMSPRRAVLIKNASIGSSVNIVAINPLNNVTSTSNMECVKQAESTLTHDTSSNMPILVDSDCLVDIVGKWVVVEYDGLPYPGIVQDINHEFVEVKVMHKIGTNIYFWPARDDILNYYFHQVVTVFEGMESVTNRHMQLPVSVWDKVCKKLDLL